MNTTKLNPIYVEGYKAGLTGEKAFPNPYWDGDHTDDAKYFAWLEGYNKGKKEYDKQSRTGNV